MKKNIRTDTGGIIIETRKRKNMSQEDLAEKMNVSVAVINSWENGDIEPNSLELKKLSEILDVDKYLIEINKKADTMTLMFILTAIVTVIIVIITLCNLDKF